MNEFGILLILCVMAIVAFGATRLPSGVGYSRGTVLTIAALGIIAATAVLLLSFSHAPLTEASGILHD
jgi:Co/Zn/Cd efflux system component